MKAKIDLNTVILLVILFALLAGGTFLFLTVRRLMQPWEQVEQIFEEGIDDLLNPTPTIIPDPVTIVHEMHNLSRLETASYTIEKIISGSSGQEVLPFLFGDELILVAYGQVVAGVNLELVSEEDIQVTEDGVVSIVLPPAEILSISLDEDKTYVFDRDTGLMGLNDDLESQVRQAAVQEIEAAALEDGILEMAQQNAETYLERLILSLGFREVHFVEAPPTPTPAP